MKIKIECKQCAGTGLYVGMAERHGAAVVCIHCNGSGCDTLTYTPFKKRKKRSGVERVFAGSFGYMHSARKETTDDGRVLNFQDAGATYAEWLKGADPKPVKQLYCPYLWTYQALQDKTHKAHQLYKDNCVEVCPGSRISDCHRWNTKHECWETFDRLTKGKGK